MGLSDIMAQPEPMPSGEVVGVVTGHHVPSHSRESSTSSTASAASICSNGGLIQTAEEEHTSPIYTPLSKCSSPTANNIIANHSVIIFYISNALMRRMSNELIFPYRPVTSR